jgi:TonB family protein
MALQSGTGGARPSGREYGVNLTFAVYQYDGQRSPSIKELTRLSGTYSTAEEEIAFLKDKYKLEDVAVRHVRSVGLRNGETFNDAVLLGPEYMVFTLTPREMVRGYMKLDLRVRYANEPLLDVKGVEFENFETVMLQGGKGMFGLKYFIGAGGRQESVPIERTLLVSVTPEIVPVTNLRNRPQELSRPVDQYGGAIPVSEADRFTPPVALERVAPKFESGRSVRGAVLLGGIVTPEGSIINIRVLRSLEPVIDERAVEAFRQYKFSPALLNGKPVHATYREELTFAPPPPSLLELEEEQRKQREMEREKERQRRKKPGAERVHALEGAGLDQGLR